MLNIINGVLQGLVNSVIIAVVALFLALVAKDELLAADAWVQVLAGGGIGVIAVGVQMWVDLRVWIEIER